ncbi:zeta toxin family protein [Algoriphagus jejuensis]|uniref:Zeta toxin family protein n=2 Tax=Algoriphagus jejuensis TaxID=419934 RepID=A0ABP3YD62_9BACT
MRVFAGPNGSGKTTIIKSLQAEIPFGVYVNADDIESLLRESRVLLFNSYQLMISDFQIKEFFKISQFAPKKRSEPDLWTKLEVKDNVLHINTSVDSYLAADLAEFIRQQLLAKGISFTYETVMSHESKLTFFDEAKQNGYRVYLYFVATEDPEINVSRVNVRVAQLGHGVAPEAIKSRYFRSLLNLKEAVKKSNRAYIWDNSGVASLLIAEITEGIDVKIIDTEKVPGWFVKYLIHSS